MTKNKKIFYGILIGSAALAIIFVIFLFSSPNTIGPLYPKEITSEEAIEFIAQNYPKTIEARGNSNIPQENITKLSDGWKIQIFWGLCPQCYCLFKVNHYGSIELLDAGEMPHLCQNDICGEEGDAIQGADTLTICCNGLSKIYDEYAYHYPHYGDDCDLMPTPRNFTCTYCGNSICGTGETKCNCPSDCQ